MLTNCTQTPPKPKRQKYENNQSFSEGSQSEGEVNDSTESQTSKPNLFDGPSNFSYGPDVTYSPHVTPIASGQSTPAGSPPFTSHTAVNPLDKMYAMASDFLGYLASTSKRYDLVQKVDSQTENSKLQCEYTALQEELENFRSAQRQWLEERDQLRLNNSQLEIALANVNEELELTKEEVATATRLLRKAKIDYEEAKNEKHQVSQDEHKTLMCSTELVQDFQEQLKQSAATIAKQLLLLADDTTVIAKLTEEKSQAQAQLAQLKQEVELCSKERTDTAERIHYLTSQLGGVHTSEEWDALRQECDKAQQEKKSLELAAEVHQQDLHTCKMRETELIASWKKIANDLQQSNNVLSEQSKKLTEMRDTSSKKYEELDKKYEELAIKHDKTKSELQAAKREKHAANKREGEHVEEIKNLNLKVDSKDKALVHLGKEKREEVARLNKVCDLVP